MEVDPSDDCTFWYTSQYQAVSGIFNWHTRITSFKFANCGSGVTVPSAPSGLTATPFYTQQGKKQVLQKIGLVWIDNSGNETAFVIQRYKITGKGPNKSCAYETTLPKVGANVTTYDDTTATTSTCRYRVAAENSAGTSAFAESNVTW